MGPQAALAALAGTAAAARDPAHLLPRWTPTWDLAASTIVQPCNFSGLMDASFLAKWGVVSMDWSNGRAAWAQQRPMDCDGMLLRQASAIKAIDPSTHVWVYRALIPAPTPPTWGVGIGPAAPRDRASITRASRFEQLGAVQS